jgi:Fe-S oxidoreductase
MPEVAKGMAIRRLHEPRQASVPRVVTACATCKKQLSRSADGLEVVDLVALLARSP